MSAHPSYPLGPHSRLAVDDADKRRPTSPIEWPWRYALFASPLIATLVVLAWTLGKLTQDI